MKRTCYSNGFGEGEEENQHLDKNIKMANVLMLLSRINNQITNNDQHRVFECRTCNRKFSSFQALGGHRASHKRPARLSNIEDDSNQGQAQRKPKVHECSICGVEFAIGQALGGHMRRHRATTNEGLGHHGFVEKKGNGKRVFLLDLNLPPFEFVEKSGS